MSVVVWCILGFSSLGSILVVVLHRAWKARTQLRAAWVLLLLTLVFLCMAITAFAHGNRLNAIAYMTATTISFICANFTAPPIQPEPYQ
jgi:drug/metabolite transporter (DMT)-like permease